MPCETSALLRLDVIRRPLAAFPTLCKLGPGCSQARITLGRLGRTKLERKVARKRQHHWPSRFQKETDITHERAEDNNVEDELKRNILSWVREKNENSLVKSGREK